MGKSSLIRAASSGVWVSTAMDAVYDATTGPGPMRGLAPGLRDARLERRGQPLAGLGRADAAEHVLEEPAHDHPLRRRPVEAAGHQVEELGAVDLADGRAVRAAHVVGLDLEAGDRRRLRVRREQQVAVLLVGVRLLRALVDPDDPAPDGARAIG